MQRTRVAALAAIALALIAAAAAHGADLVAASVARAQAARRAGDRAAELVHWAAVLERDAGHPVAHERLAQLTGPAPRRPLRDPTARLQRALDHPYDPQALLDAADVLAGRGEPAAAVEHLERAVWLADVDPEAALAALIALRALDARGETGWRTRRVVPVHVHADAAFRAQPGWRFALRTLWSSASHALDGVLATRFVPIAIGSVDLSDVPGDLDAMHAAFVARVSPPEEGILAAVSGRPVPDDGGVHKTGIAEFLGRDLVVRVAPGARQSRVLAHEILHLYGAIHVLDGVESLMNPTGTSLLLDAGSVRIARAMRRRGFGAGGIEANVLPAIDLRAATDAYVDALSANLSVRDAGLSAARREVVALDAHFADASRLLAALLVADARRADAAHVLELAASLYGPGSERGRRAAADAAALREAPPASSGEAGLQPD